ncbi:replication initiator protein A [Methylobacterium sp. WL116]|uniref:replication initiator protein A n=1 Tax=Methylobacterium sp. WL116 TaxID=2603889 RepID=UPI00164FDFE4|nr:replication initiator protein A [Methylobacterium sp. WL116]
MSSEPKQLGDLLGEAGLEAKLEALGKAVAQDAAARQATLEQTGEGAQKRQEGPAERAAQIQARNQGKALNGSSGQAVEPRSPAPALTQQIDLFIATGRAAAPKDELATMEHPVYAIEDGDQRIMTYEHNGVTLEVTPSVKGRATIHDKDIVLTCVSKVVDAVNRGEPVSRTVSIKAHDVLTFTNRSTSGRGYELLEQALERLAGTRIKTSIATGKPARRRTKGFGLIDAWETITRGPNNRLEELRITLSEFTFDAAMALEVLSIDQNYFKLRKATEKRLYELARKHCGDQGRWKVGLELLQKKVGSRQPLFKFRAAVRSIGEEGSLPGYHLVFLHTDDSVVFYGRSAVGLVAMESDLVTLPKPKAEGSRRKSVRRSTAKGI